MTPEELDPEAPLPTEVDFRTQSWGEYCRIRESWGFSPPTNCPVCGVPYSGEVTFKLGPSNYVGWIQPITGTGCSEECATVNAVQRNIAHAGRSLP